MIAPVPGICVRAGVVLALAAGAALGGLTGCASGPPPDPIRVLSTSGLDSSHQLAAIEQLSKQDPMTEEARRTIRRLLTGAGFNMEVRQAAFNLLAERDRKALIENLQATISRLDAWEFREWIVTTVGQRNWRDFTVVVVNSWAQQVPVWGGGDLGRPEYRAMRELYGPRTADGKPERIPDGAGPTDAAVVDALFGVLMESNPITQAALRARTWELLMRLGQRERLQELVANTAYRPDDVMLRDIRQLSVDLGILPETREELLWLAKLRQTASPAYWQMASAALKQVPELEKRRFELRGVAVAIAAAKYKPEVLSKSAEELYERLVITLKARGAGRYSPNFQGYGEGHTELLTMQHDQATWIDLVAMLLALDMADQPGVRATLFDIGDRDQQDRLTEYGGVIRINDKGEYEVVEVRPRVTGNDSRYDAPQEVFDLGYTALFHFHFHAQSYENAASAGPHVGDFAYAASTRANCLVFCYLKRSTLDFDFYRHGPFVVDLGTFERN